MLTRTFGEGEKAPDHGEAGGRGLEETGDKGVEGKKKG